MSNITKDYVTSHCLNYSHMYIYIYIYIWLLFLEYTDKECVKYIILYKGISTNCVTTKRVITIRYNEKE